MVELNWNALNETETAFLKEYTLEGQMRHSSAITDILGSMKSKCDRCARCCRLPLVRVGESGQTSLAAHFGLSTEAFRRTYMMDESYLKRPCPFLVKRRTCLIYPLRPEGCKAYPFHVTRPFLYLDPKCAYSAAIQDFFEQHQTEIEVLAEKIWSQLDEAKYARCRTIYVKAGFDWDDKVANGSLASPAELDKTRLLHTRPAFVVPEVDALSVTVQVEEAIRDTLKNQQIAGDNSSE